jgi:hypothetical protein
MELITAAYCWQIINKFPAWPAPLTVKQYCQALHKLITSLHSKRYQPSGMPIHLQNSHAPHDKWRTGRCEKQSRELKKVKKKLS